MVIFEIYADERLLRRTIVHSEYERNRRAQLELGDTLVKQYPSRHIRLEILYCTVEDSETIDLNS
jgi:hypothetical protein